MEEYHYLALLPLTKNNHQHYKITLAITAQTPIYHQTNTQLKRGPQTVTAIPSTGAIKEYCRRNSKSLKKLFIPTELKL